MIAIISDIHGNYPAVEAVLADIEKREVDRIYCLGDIAGYYCMINECIEALRARDVVLLMGNHDYYLINNKSCPRSPTATKCLAFQRNIITCDNLAWLRGRPSQLTFDNVFMVHGGRHDPLEEYIYEIGADYFSGRDEKFFFAGHVHVQAKHVFENTIFCNPGSVGQPRDGVPAAAYAVMDGAEIDLRRVDYDTDAVAFRMRKAGFDEYTYSNLYAGTRIGGKRDTISMTGR